MFQKAQSRIAIAKVDTSSKLLELPGTASLPSSGARANQVHVYGVDESFWRFADQPGTLQPTKGAVVLNHELATQIGANTGDELLLRVERPGRMSRESAVMQREDQSIGLRLTVAAVLPSDSCGELDLRAGGTPAMNAFVDLEALSTQIGLRGKANLWLSSAFTKRPLSRPGFVTYFQSLRAMWSQYVLHKMTMRVGQQATTRESLDFLRDCLQESWSLEDAGLQLNYAPDSMGIELRSPRVFLDPPVVSAATRLTGANQIPLLTYLANLIAAASNATPYSMVTAAGPPYTPAGMADDEIVVSDWLAEDLGVKAGDTVLMSYFLPDSGANLMEGTNRFRVHSIVAQQGVYADKTLMPDFPGLDKAESTRDWDAAFPLVYKIRPKDEQYWKERRGTPKAFITLAAGKRMWANRFGELTAIRVPDSPDQTTAENWGRFSAALMKDLKPEELGLRWEPVREQALMSADQAQDFGQLFLGFSFFLIAAALVLMALLFQFGLEQRSIEVGTLLALGFAPRRVRKMFLLEGIVLSFTGGLIGVLGGIGYAKGMLWGLATIWRNAVGGSSLKFHLSALSLVIGLCASTLIAVLTIAFTLRKLARQPARELLAEGAPLQKVNPAGDKARGGLKSIGAWLGLGAGLAALGLTGWALAKGEKSNPEIFFSAGSLLLMGGLGWIAAWFSVLARSRRQKDFTLANLSVRGCALRRKRSLATVALLACGCFVILAIGVFRLDANQDALNRFSGTGGFALIGESTLPVLQDLNSPRGREFFGLGADELAGTKIVSLKVHNGDEASCLNLSRALTPRLLGVHPGDLAGRFTFSAVAKGLEMQNGWELLEHKNEPGGRDASSTEIPAIGDANSIEWALGKKLGDSIDYTDDQGRIFQVKLVGAVANSILQGSLLIDKEAFVKRFPGESGFRMFLIDTPSNSIANVSSTLSRSMQDVGLQLTPAVTRLNAFNAVQNTYLGTFQVLGGLGLLLGSAGLGVVVLRNVLERRGELGLLLAIGFRRRALERLVLSEHGALLGLGLGLGLIAAAIAVLPALLTPGAHLPYASLALTLIAVLLNGATWTWLATRFALRGNLLSALQNE
jgi:ABC-type antimicrobial peptide transport system permease subunit